MTKQITLEEVLELVTFAQTSVGTWYVKDVKGSVGGNVEGDIWADVWGSVLGDVCGDVCGDVKNKVSAYADCINKGYKWEFIEEENNND